VYFSFHSITMYVLILDLIRAARFASMSFSLLHSVLFVVVNTTGLGI